MIAIDKYGKEHDICDVKIEVTYGSLILYHVFGYCEDEYYRRKYCLIDTFFTVEEAIALHSTLDAALKEQRMVANG